MGARVDLAGQRLGRLFVERIGEQRGGGGDCYWVCRCDCGTVREIRGKSLRAGDAVSCGCFRSSREYRARTIRDLAGRRFGSLRVVGLDESVGRGGARWNCLCDCGNKTTVRADSLVTGKTRSCGCYRPTRLHDHAGKRFGRLTAEHQARGGRSPAWHCICDCGSRVVVIARSLVHGVTRSCGCLSRTAGGKSMTPEYRASYEQLRQSRKKASGGSFNHAQIEDLYRKQRGKCAVCREPVKLSKMQRDHIEPIALGGSSDITNIQLLCRPCNQSKHAKPPIDFMQSRGFLL